MVSRHQAYSLESSWKWKTHLSVVEKLVLQGLWHPRNRDTSREELSTFYLRSCQVPILKLQIDGATWQDRAKYGYIFKLTQMHAKCIVISQSELRK